MKCLRSQKLEGTLQRSINKEDKRMTGSRQTDDQDNKETSRDCTLSARVLTWISTDTVQLNDDRGRLDNYAEGWEIQNEKAANGVKGLGRGRCRCGRSGLLSFKKIKQEERGRSNWKNVRKKQKAEDTTKQSNRRGGMPQTKRDTSSCVWTFYQRPGKEWSGTRSIE
jgi:hypothetical protein